MPDKNGGEDIPGKPRDESIGTPPPPAKTGTTQNECTTEKLEKDIKRGEWWLLRIGVATLVINTIIAYIYFQQLTQMRIATEASMRAVDLANDTLKYNNGNFDRAMQQTTAQTASQYTATEASKKAADAAKSAAVTAKDTLYISERAWVFFSSTLMAQDLDDANSKIRIKVGFINSGKTPALGVKIFTRVGVYHVGGIPSEPDWTNSVGENTYRAMLPPTATPLAIDAHELDVPIASRKAYEDGLSRIILQSRIEYRDTFRKKHWIYVCGAHTRGNALSDFEMIDFQTDEEQQKQ